MCGRFTIIESKEDLEEFFQVKIPNNYVPRYNAAPSQSLPVVLNTDPTKAEMVRWGLKPVWFDPKRKDGLINVRAENLREKPTFKADLKNRRCLILADGFYEWQATKDGKQPYRIVMKDRRPFVFAGIWEVNKIDDKEVITFAIITTTPNSVLLPIHTRMPVVLRRGNEAKWLQEPNLDLLEPYADKEMFSYRVSLAVNNARNDIPELISSLDTEQ